MTTISVLYSHASSCDTPQIDVSNYKKLEYAKDEQMYDMLKIIMEDNILFRNCKSEEKVDILVRNEYMPSPCARTHAPTHCPPHLPPTPIHTPMTTRPPPS